VGRAANRRPSARGAESRNIDVREVQSEFSQAQRDRDVQDSIILTSLFMDVVSAVLEPV
jgi:hypothetical protein